MNDLILFENKFSVDPQYAGMLDIINQAMPEVQRGTSLFQKTQSQFMDNMLTVSHLTPIRNLRQILAEMKKTRLALGEAYYGIQKKEIEIEEKEYEKASALPIRQRRLEIEIEELQWQISCIRENVTGAIRKLTNYSLQYQTIQEQYGLQGFAEEDFEEEEERYHICKAFEQGLNAARARQGFIDEGNQIYFSQIGINGTVAQVEVANYLNRESVMLSTGQEPTHEMQVEFLLSMAEKFKGCSRRYAEFKGLQVMTPEALIR